ncbi:MAG: hypothetical protein FJX68_19465 [Alphaproteobacteria bacterium]|nr:hypothetical protein [Alphaproteobacteria bacterium]
MTTTPEALLAMKRADWLRAKRASSSMHHSWWDANALAKGMLELQKQQSEKPLPDWLIELCPDLAET